MTPLQNKIEEAKKRFKKEYGFLDKEDETTSINENIADFWIAELTSIATLAQEEARKEIMSNKISTMMEFNIQQGNNDYYKRIKSDLATVLDFVERHNKQDKEVDVANAAQFLSTLSNNTQL